MTDPKIELISIDQLIPDPENAREHPEDNLAAIKGSLERFGQVKPLVVDSGNRVLAGNATLQVAKDLGWTKLSVIRVPDSWTPEEATGYALADNRTAELAEWDGSVLAAQLVELDAVGWDLNELGFPSLTPPDDPDVVVDGKLLGAEQSDLLRCPSCGFVFQESK